MTDRVHYKYLVGIYAVAITVVGIILYYQVRLPNDPDSLIEALADNNVPAHLNAGQKLMRLGKDPLVRALRHPDYRVRGRAAHFLGLLGDKTVVSDLIEASNDKNPYVRS